MKFKIENLLIPENIKVIQHNFSTYDPLTDYTEEDNLTYLNEDLFQAEIENINLIIDLGWYGEIWNNDGEFKIFVIMNYDWENPIITESSKSQKKIKAKLETILHSLKNENL